MPAIVTEAEFYNRATQILKDWVAQGNVARMVTGPGRSGAIAAVYASHFLGIPFLPYGETCPAQCAPLLIVDTAIMSGATIRKAARKYAYAEPQVLGFYHEPPRVIFWYENDAIVHRQIEKTRIV